MHYQRSFNVESGEIELRFEEIKDEDSMAAYSEISNQGEILWTMDTDEVYSFKSSGCSAPLYIAVTQSSPPLEVSPNILVLITPPGEKINKDS